MKTYMAIPLCFALLANCSTGSSSSSASQTITPDAIETCWKQVGIKGDLYKFMTPSEAAGLQPGGAFSEEQVVQFKTCLGV